MRYLSQISFFVLSPFLLSHPVLAAMTFNASNLEQKDDYYILTASVSGMSSSSECYIQGVFTPKDKTSYFGFTWNKKAEWMKYISSPEKEYILENFVKVENDIPTNILIRPDFEDGNYSGPGEYTLKLRRYTSGGSATDFQPQFSVTLSQTTPTPEPTEEITPTPTATATPSLTNTPTPTPTPTPTKTPTPTPTKTATPSPSTKTTVTPTKSELSLSEESDSTSSSDILGASTGEEELDEPTPTDTQAATSQEKNKKPIMVIGVLLVTLSSGLLLFRRLKGKIF